MGRGILGHGTRRCSWARLGARWRGAFVPGGGCRERAEARARWEPAGEEGGRPGLES